MLRNTANDLIQSDAPNYLPTAVAGGAFFASTLVSMLDCGSTSFYANAMLTLAFSALAANQYGWAKSFEKAKETGGHLKSKTMSFFQPAKEHAAEEAKAEETKAVRPSRK